MSANPSLYAALLASVRPSGPTLECPSCEGRGYFGSFANGSDETCSDCKGQAIVLCTVCDAPAVSKSPGEWSCSRHLTHCVDCDGPVTDGEDCPACLAAHVARVQRVAE